MFTKRLRLSILMPKSSTESLDLIFKHTILISTPYIYFDFNISTFEIYQDLLQDDWTRDTKKVIFKIRYDFFRTRIKNYCLKNCKCCFL